MKLRFFAIILVAGFIRTGAHGQEMITVDQAISAALEKNYDVRVARQVQESTETDDRYAVMAFFPTVNATASTVWTKNEQQLRFQDASRNNSGRAENNNKSASLQMAWTLFDGAKMFATRERISEIAARGDLLVKNEMVNTIASVITNYYNIVRQKQQLRAIQEQMAVSEERVKLAEKKLQVGTGVKPELLQARVDLNAQRAQIIQQETAIEQLKAQLNVLAGMQLPESFEVADTIIIDLNLDTEAFTNLENSNYQLLSARRNLSIAALSLRERRAEYLPVLNFNAAYNFNENDNTRLINPFASVFSQTEGFNYGFTVSVPLFNGLNTRRLTEQAKIEVGRQGLLYEQQRTTINMNLLNAMVNYDNAREILVIEEETIGAARENLAIALETFKRGVTTAIELRTAQQSLADAYNRLISARYNAKLAETELLRLNGTLLK